MRHFVLDSEDLGTLEYLVTHVFCPLQLPGGNDHSIRNDIALAEAVSSAAHLYSDHVCRADLPKWHSILRMLDNLWAIVQFENLDGSQAISQLTDMNEGDVLALLIQAQNAAVVFRKQKDVTVFESFEVSPRAEKVATTQGKLICSFPGPAIEIPNLMFDDENFLSELVNFLVHMNNDILDAAPRSRKAQTTVLETRDTTHPRYITELLTGILRSVGRPANVVRISKRVGDDVVWNKSRLPWRRSSLWLLIRVTLQTTLERSTCGHDTYKAFMVFFMCCLAKEQMSTDLSNDLLHFMSVKISRRLWKLGSSAPDWLSRTVLQTCTFLRSTLEKRWRQVQAAQRVSPVWAPSQLDLTKDIQLSLQSSASYLLDCLSNHDTHTIDTPFTPKDCPRGVLDDFLSSDGAFFKEAYDVDPHVTLYDVERAVEEDIDGWVDRVADYDGACVKLELLANKYSSCAVRVYGNNPEFLSVMLLTTIELWVALDKIVIQEIPILADYSPEIPTSLLECLLVRKPASLYRLCHVYQYISHRHSQSHNGWSVFSPSLTGDNFAVRYFRGSSHLQSLKSQIEADAQGHVDKKVVELEKENIRYANLRKQCLDTSHSSVVTEDGRRSHPKKCTRCRLERKLGRMEIAVHEWPLPIEDRQAELAVFELDCPVSFNMWRSATFHLLVDLCSPTPEQEKPYLKLDQYAALRPYLVKHPRSRISLGSTTKPFVVTHYCKTPLPSTPSRVCVNNGLTFYVYDSCACIPVSKALGSIDARRYCTYKLQSGPYQNLQKYVDATSHTSNEILANQADCHKDLSIHEFIAFGHLRGGGALQWLNILRSLRDRSLSFPRHEVHLLVAQAVSQVGPFGSFGWSWHHDIQQPSFCYALMEELESLLMDIKANWLEGVTMNTISFILTRLLASSHDHVCKKATGLLRVVREKVFTWVMDLSNKLAGTQGDEELRALLRDTAAVCRSTFDVDPALVQEVLSSAEDIEVLLSCAILIHDNTPGNVSSLPAYSQLLLDRDRHLSLVLEDVLSKIIIQSDFGGRGIDLAVLRVWPFYRPGLKWNPFSRWVSCTTASTTNQRAQTVYLDLLDGTLLIDGKPLGRLPDAIVRQPLYDLVFGMQVLDVIPADLPGMDYATRDAISGHQVYFSLVNDNLVMRAKRVAPSNSTIIELVPREKLTGDLPEVLIEGHAHWLDLSTSVLEIRPSDNLWERSSENWEIDCVPGQYRMRKGPVFLVDMRSATWIMVSNLLKPLDSSQNLIITASPGGQPKSSLQLSVDLPRYGLSFYVDMDGDLQSRNIRDMVYDENQSIGTMFGLANRLVLRPKLGDVHADELVARCVLIPEGKISFCLENHHVRIDIDTRGPALQRIAYQTYRVDTDLGCLTGNVSLTNKLYCAYLHALTSGCSIDPLTGRSGTEEAMSLLWSASCWSIMKFSPRDAELLGLIASICPSRTWYPENHRSMQKVGWLDLPASTQHPELYVVAKAIKEHCERVLLFHGNHSTLDSLFQDFPSYDETLLNRSALRARYLFPPGFSPRLSGAGFDVKYPGRDLVESNSGEHRAYTAAASVFYRNANGITANCIKNVMESWNEQTVFGTAPLSLQYDRSWLSPNLSSMWLQTYNLLRRSHDDEEKWAQLLFSLSALAYASPKLGNLVPAFIAFATVSSFRSEDPPHQCDSYTIPDGYCPTEDTLRTYVPNCAYSFECSPEGTELPKTTESPKELRRRQLKMYTKRLDVDADATVRQLLSAWPCETPPPCSLDPNLYDVEKFTLDVQRLFFSCYCNLMLKEHLTRVQMILNSHHSQASPISTLPYSFCPSQSNSTFIPWSITVDKLLSKPAPQLRQHNRLPRYSSESGNTSVSGSASLQQLIVTAEANAVNSFQHQYVSALSASAECFGDETPITHEVMKPPTVRTLEAHYNRCRDDYIEVLHRLRQHLGPVNPIQKALDQSGLWPRITAHSLFCLLASNSRNILSNDWRRCLTGLTLLALELQRARRLLRLQLCGLVEELHKELQNDGCDGWNAEAHPDWLLIQLQGNFLIRRVQIDVAKEMISPHSGTNTAMQLNMGEGKSSVIIPISVTALADGNQLVRVIVPKALTAQMFHLLVGRLGGLTNRRIYFIPFSRSLEVSPQQVAALRDVMVECMKERGVLVVQPEHILSLKLVSVEKQLSQPKDKQVPGLLLELQKWLHSHSRDILDESDEILHVRYQLVYTIGLQQPMEGFPERWTTTQQVLSLVKKHASSLQMHSPFGVEYECGLPGSFPHFRVLQVAAGQQLILRIVRDIMNGHLPSFSFQRLHPRLKDAIQDFISCENDLSQEAQLVEEYAKGCHLWIGLLHLRGLLAAGIFLFAFTERRWRVDYGLAPARTMLAVPYRAKDVPAQRAEFGHPDVTIILTCLSYYYGGLEEEQLRVSFEILLKQDDPSLDYGFWVRECPSVPESLQTLNGINLRSSEQWCKLLLPLFSRNKATVDFYLSKVVFPREAKEFPSKLSCSGWDLAEKRDRLLTGFSGTNDGQYLLPLQITQRDPDHQRGTNAKVLAYLLQPENNHYMCTTHEGGERRTTTEFLDILATQKPDIRVLLDVGAQMLDLQNHELVAAWLVINPAPSAAIYFNEDDELTVLTRDGSTQLLFSSPFAQQLDQCIIYLDDAHTRGTDISFPSGFRAAVTLGPKVTKDRLTQGCMRMRKLGHGHSIMFFAPLEVDRRIRSVVDKDPSSVVDVMDILQWVIRETCDDIQQRAPHWAQQGMDHASRYNVWTSFCRGELTPRQLSTQWLQPEAKRLEDLYGQRDTLNPAEFKASPDIYHRCKFLGVSSLSAASAGEEQEREVIHEAERERQVERPPRAKPAVHSLHRDVATFIRTGAIRLRTKAFCPAFEMLHATSAVTNEPHVWSPPVLVTKDFATTVSSPGKLDEYLRPVQWVVSGKRDGVDVLVVLSPYEADHLIRSIRLGKKVHLHLYTPRITKSMRPCDNLALYSIPTVPSGWTPPSTLMDQLNVFAGQLYLKDYATYVRLCRFLCIYVAEDLPLEEGVEIGSDGFIAPKHRPQYLQTSRAFESTPTVFLRLLMSLRRKGMNFAPTHMGMLLDGRQLSKSDFDGCHDNVDE